MLGLLLYKQGGTSIFLWKSEQYFSRHFGWCDVIVIDILDRDARQFHRYCGS